MMVRISILIILAMIPDTFAKTTVLVTGASQGLGLAICECLVKRSEGYHVIMGCRDVEKGTKALANMSSGPGSAEVVCLDVNNVHHIDSIADLVRSRYQNSFGAIINNAGVGLDLPFQAGKISHDTARKTIMSNFFGAVAVTNALLPYLGLNSRIVNISSGTGARNLDYMSEENRQRMLNENLTTDELIQIAEEFISTFEDEHSKGSNLPMLSSNGYWLQAYGFSKAAMNMWTRILARERPDLAINACSPGMVRTAMMSEYDPSVELRTPEDGAESLLWLICDDLNGKSGKFFGNDRTERDWVKY